MVLDFLEGTKTGKGRACAGRVITLNREVRTRGRGAGWATQVPPSRVNSKCKGPGAGAMNALCVQGEHGGQKGEARVSSLEREDMGSCS